MNVQTIDKLHKTRLGYLVFGLVELGLAWAVSLRAIDSGNLFWWVLTVILLVGFLQNFVRMVVYKK